MVSAGSESSWLFGLSASGLMAGKKRCEILAFLSTTFRARKVKPRKVKLVCSWWPGADRLAEKTNRVLSGCNLRPTCSIRSTITASASSA